MSTENARAAGTIGPEVTLVEEVSMVRQERWEELPRLWQQERVPVAELARRFELDRKTVRRRLRALRGANRRASLRPAPDRGPGHRPGPHRLASHCSGLRRLLGLRAADYNLLFRWFVGLGMDDPLWDATVFTKNRERLLAGDVARAPLEQVVAEARARHLLSSEHFSLDGTLIEAWASLKSFQPKDGPAVPPSDDPGNPTIDFHGDAAGTTPTPRRPIPRRGSIGRARATRPSSPTTGT